MLTTDRPPATPPAPARLTRFLPQALQYARLDRHEIAGSLGDLGTFLPLLVGMSAQNGLNFAAALLFSRACSTSSPA